MFDPFPRTKIHLCTEKDTNDRKQSVPVNSTKTYEKILGRIWLGLNLGLLLTQVVNGVCRVVEWLSGRITSGRIKWIS